MLTQPIKWRKNLASAFFHSATMTVADDTFSLTINLLSNENKDDYLQNFWAAFSLPRAIAQEEDDPTLSSTSPPHGYVDRDYRFLRPLSLFDTAYLARFESISTGMVIYRGAWFQITMPVEMDPFLPAIRNVAEEIPEMSVITTRALLRL